MAFRSHYWGPKGKGTEQLDMTYAVGAAPQTGSCQAVRVLFESIAVYGVSEEHLKRLGIPHPEGSCWFQLQTPTAPSFLVFIAHRPSHLLVIGTENNLKTVLQDENLFEPGKYGFCVWFTNSEHYGIIENDDAEPQFVLSNDLQHKQVQAIKDEYNNWISLLPSKATSNHILSHFSPCPECLVYELVQNAVDAGATDISFTIKAGSELVVEHNGRPFDLVDVHALTNFATSSKLPKSDSIGYKGIGFKSVFAVTSNVQISSPPFNLSYSKKMSGQFTYIQLDSCELKAAAVSSKTTTVALRIASADAVQAIRGQIESMLSSNALLILNSLGKPITRMSWKDGNKTLRTKSIPEMPDWCGDGFEYRVVQDQEMSYLMIRSGNQPSNYICLCLNLTRPNWGDGQIFTFLPLELAKRQYVMDIHAPFTVDHRRQNIEKDETSSKVWDQVAEAMTFMMQALHKICQEPQHHELLKKVYWMLVPPERSPPREAFEDAFSKTPLVLTLPNMTLEKPGSQIVLENKGLRPNAPYVDLIFISTNHQQSSVLSLLQTLPKLTTNSSNMTRHQDFWEGMNPERLIYVEKPTSLTKHQFNDHLDYCGGIILQSTATMKRTDIVWMDEAWEHAKLMVKAGKVEPLKALFEIAINLPTTTQYLDVKPGGSYKEKRFEMKGVTISFLERMKDLGRFVFFQGKFYLPSEILCSSPNHESEFPQMPSMTAESSKVPYYEAMGIFRHDSLGGLINRLRFVKKEATNQPQKYSMKDILSEAEEIYLSIQSSPDFSVDIKKKKELTTECLIFAPDEQGPYSSWTAPETAHMAILEKHYHDKLHHCFSFIGVPLKRDLRAMVEALGNDPNVGQISELCKSLSRVLDGKAECDKITEILRSPNFKLRNFEDYIIKDRTPWAVRYGHYLKSIEKLPPASSLFEYDSCLIHQDILESCSPALIEAMREQDQVRCPTVDDIVCIEKPKPIRDHEFGNLLSEAISLLNATASKLLPFPLFPWKFCAMENRELKVRIFDCETSVRGIFYEGTIFAHGYDNVMPALALALAVQPPAWPLVPSELHIPDLLNVLEKFFKAYLKQGIPINQKRDALAKLEAFFRGRRQPGSSSSDAPTDLVNDLDSLNIEQTGEDVSEADEDNKEEGPDWEDESQSPSEVAVKSDDEKKPDSSKPINTSTDIDSSDDEKLDMQLRTPFKPGAKTDIPGAPVTPKSDKKPVGTHLSTTTFVGGTPKSAEQREKDKQMGDAAEIAALRYEQQRLRAHPLFRYLPFIQTYPNEDETELLKAFVCSTSSEPLSSLKHLLPQDYLFSQTAPWDIHSYEFIEDQWTRIRLEVKSSAKAGSRSFQLSSGEYKHLQSTLEEGEFPYVIYFYSGFSMESPATAPTYRLYFSKPEDFNLIEAVPRKYELKILDNTFLLKHDCSASLSALPSYKSVPAHSIEKQTMKDAENGKRMDLFSSSSPNSPAPSTFSSSYKVVPVHSIETQATITEAEKAKKTASSSFSAPRHALFSDSSSSSPPYKGVPENSTEKQATIQEAEKSKRTGLASSASPFPPAFSAFPSYGSASAHSIEKQATISEAEKAKRTASFSVTAPNSPAPSAFSSPYKGVPEKLIEKQATIPEAEKSKRTGLASSASPFPPAFSAFPSYGSASAHSIEKQATIFEAEKAKRTGLVSSSTQFPPGL